MDKVKVKICGITDYNDARLAVELGVDALGFIFAPSPRRISPEAALKIISALPPFILKTGVFVNESQKIIDETVRFCGLDLIQLHGDESPDICECFMPRSIKAFQIKDGATLQSVEPYQGKVMVFLFDAYSKEKRGGTGETFNWDLAVAGKKYGVPVILSGGLSPLNIEKAILNVRPYAVDVNSGIETSPGKKSPGLMKKLMQIINNLREITSG